MTQGCEQERDCQRLPTPAYGRKDLDRQLSAVRASLDALANRLERTAAEDVRNELVSAAAQLARLAEGIFGPPAPSPPVRASNGLGRVLLVDDEPLAVECISEYLDGRGYEVLPASSPRDALALAATRTIDVVVTDLRMGGMDGWQLVAELRRANPGLPALVVTGNADALAGKEDASITVMRKPLALDRLEATLATLLGDAVEPAP